MTDPKEPPSWWSEFWDRYEQNNGISREEAVRRLSLLLGHNYRRRPLTELYPAESAALIARN